LRINRSSAASKVVVLLAVLTTCAQAQTARAQDGWQPLTTEPSRGELFQSYADSLAPILTGGMQSFAFPYKFIFPVSAIKDINGRVRTDRIFGIDLSRYEGNNVPFDQFAPQSIAFAYTKATQGTGYFDPTFKNNWVNLEDKKIPRGAYHFLSSSSSQSGKDQADRFLDYVKLAEGGGVADKDIFKDGDLRPAVDLEWDVACADRTSCPDRWNTRTSDDIVATTAGFIDEVRKRTGWTCLVYTNESFLSDHHIKAADYAKLANGKHFWIFDISKADLNLEKPDPSKNLDFVLWQFSWGGRLSPGTGYAHDVDVNVYIGSANSFKNDFLVKN
jgi:lysozyme